MPGDNWNSKGGLSLKDIWIGVGIGGLATAIAFAVLGFIAGQFTH